MSMNNTTSVIPGDFIPLGKVARQRGARARLSASGVTLNRAARENLGTRHVRPYWSKEKQVILLARANEDDSDAYTVGINGQFHCGAITQIANETCGLPVIAPVHPHAAGVTIHLSESEPQK